MNIQRVVIKNFRSIKNLEFHPSSICALVGENGAGKSNILAALDFLLGERWPQSRNLDISDYYEHDESNSVFIGIEFGNSPSSIQAIWFDGSEEKYQTRYKLYQDSQEWRALTSEIREKCALVYLDASRDINRDMGSSRWTLFGRIIRQFDGTFPENKKADLKERFGDVEALLRTMAFGRFENELNRAFQAQVKQVDHTLGLRFRAYDPYSYYRTLQLLMFRGDQEVHLSEIGQGMRNLALMAMFRAYAKEMKDDAIIAIEEPEIYLHPHAQRSLATLFKELASKSSQIFYSTHSSQFIDIESFDQICLVEKCVDDEGDLCTHIRQVSMDQLLEMRRALHPDIEMTELGLRERYQRLRSISHSEAFFARKIILVEGETEEFSLPIYSNSMDYDFDANGVSVVNAGGKTNLDQFYHLYKAFQIPIYMIFDNDRGPKPDKNQWNARLLEMLGEPPVEMPDGIVSTKYAIMDKDFEGEMQSYLGISEYNVLVQEARREVGSESKSILARYVAKTLTTQGLIPTFIAEIVSAVKLLGEQSDIDNDLADDILW